MERTPSAQSRLLPRLGRSRGDGTSTAGRPWARRATSLLASLAAVGLIAFGAYLLTPAAGYIVGGLGILLLDFADGGL